jgi:hypothetical protein
MKYFQAKGKFFFITTPDHITVEDVNSHENILCELYVDGFEEVDSVPEAQARRFWGFNREPDFLKEN